ncbi:MAG: lipid-A-disaccharide synthase [Planctomycetaceae bacterium]|nr:lipid-A-disaccharide synthase [Planctomycetaceae bacterium]
MRIFFSAGEPSGDQHTAILISELRRLCPGAEFEGLGGPAMREQGCRLLFELTELAVMGFLRVVPLLAQFRKLVKQAEAHFDTNPPDAVVLVDFPGFNWWIARAAKSRGIPVFYYLPPQLWAWAPWRIRRVRKWVDHVICSLPFEFEWYKQRGIPATWVGHPFFDEVAAHSLNSAAMMALRPPSSHDRVVAVLPGSRDHEVQKNWPVMLRTMHAVAQRVSGIRWIVGNYKEVHMHQCAGLLAESGLNLNVEFVAGSTSEVIQSADCCLMVSGSISLELLARHKPGVVLYRAPRIGCFAARFLMNCRFITLTNLIAGKEVMPEYISSGDPSGDIQSMASHLVEWLSDEQTLKRRISELQKLADSAAQTGATGRAARLIFSQLAEGKDSLPAAA